MCVKADLKTVRDRESETQWDRQRGQEKGRGRGEMDASSISSVSHVYLAAALLEGGVVSTVMDRFFCLTDPHDVSGQGPCDQLPWPHSPSPRPLTYPSSPLLSSSHLRQTLWDAPPIQHYRHIQGHNHGTCEVCVRVCVQTCMRVCVCVFCVHAWVLKRGA